VTSDMAHSFIEAQTARHGEQVGDPNSFAAASAAGQRAVVHAKSRPALRPAVKKLGVALDNRQLAAADGARTNSDRRLARHVERSELQ